MDLVASISDIKQNLNTMFYYSQSPDDGLRNFFKELIKRGTCFVVVNDGNRLFFGPSRFVGYRGNSHDRHISNTEKHGSTTNNCISKLLDRNPIPDKAFDQRYIKFCADFGVNPGAKGSFGVTRKYWVIGGSIGPAPEGTESSDLAEILNKTIDTTTKISLVLARLGQGVFREALIQKWGACVVTGCKLVTMLRASHIKPWKTSTDFERLDPFNGLLLVPNVDVAFDRGLISFDDQGKILISEQLSQEDREIIGIHTGMQVSIEEQHRTYLAVHRESVFRP